jgi:hypothetical protein
MSKNAGSKDKSLEALDFIINVMKDHEKVLDQSINALASVTEQMGVMDILNSKVDKVEAEINNLRKEITDLVVCLSPDHKDTTPAIAKTQETEVQTLNAPSSAIISVGSHVVFHCAQWEDFQVLAANAEWLSYKFKESEKVLQIQAFKANQIIAYTGSLLDFGKILKTWLSQQVKITEQNIFESF